MTEKTKVKGNDKHPIYQWLTDKTLNNSYSSSVKWNFQKYLVSPEGKLINYWYSLTKPMSSKITKYLE
jgi:glutathione peroxidase